MKWILSFMTLLKTYYSKGKWIIVYWSNLIYIVSYLHRFERLKAKDNDFDVRFAHLGNIGIRNGITEFNWENNLDVFGNTDNDNIWKVIIIKTNHMTLCHIYTFYNALFSLFVNQNGNLIIFMLTVTMNIKQIILYCLFVISSIEIFLTLSINKSFTKEDLEITSNYL